MDVAQRLREHGYRLTPQRRVVCQTLSGAERHLSAEEIHARAGGLAPELNLASVYRTLALLGELGLARQVQLGDGKGQWEVAHPDDAFHLVCRGCGVVAHHAGDLVDRVRAHLTHGHGFTPEAIDLVVRGLCEACAQGEPLS